MTAPEIPELHFLQQVRQSGHHMMWFLGAGASRSSGLPTATDITWDLKRRLYCAEQNQDIQTHDISNKAVQARIQGYLDGKGFPPLWDATEYSFYFERTFGSDYGAQQAYLREALATEKISSTVGHRALAALLATDRARVIFTTNFDEVVETAYAALAGKNLTAFHLEGSYAAIAALNAERFPLYAKVHGDFRFQSIKNLSQDLRSNDEQIQKCLVAAATRFGMIVAGYSGRDANVMEMFKLAVEQNNAFPHGLYWTAPRLSGVLPQVKALLEYAVKKGVKCGLVQTGTFDEMLSKIWRQTLGKPPEVDAKVRSAAARTVSIALPRPGNSYPVLRTNALLVTKLPSSCGTVELDDPVNMSEIRARLFEEMPDCTLTYTDRMLFWGARSEIEKVLDADRIRSTKPYEFDDLAKAVDESGHVKAFIEETIARALIRGKPLILRKDARAWHAVVKHGEAEHEIYKHLRAALGWQGSLASVNGGVPFLPDVFWSESVSLRIEERNGSLWLLLKPEIWISPLQERQKASEFLIQKKLRRYNTQSDGVLSAWIEILLGSVGTGRPAAVAAFPDSDFSAQFEISTRTAYSRKQSSNA